MLRSIGFAALVLLATGPALALEATYRATFTTLWNRSDHPNNYPSSAHFSPLIGASHSSAVNFWGLGQSATAGIEQVAELGQNSVFRGEINGALADGDALHLVEIPRNLFTGQTGTSTPFTVTEEHPLVTFATMVAPSSDWFVGVHDLDLRDGDGFVEELAIEFTTFYDAGTEEGNRFSLSNPATNPRGVITEVTGADAAAPFLGGSANELPPIATLVLTRESIVGLPGDFDLDGVVSASDLAVWRSEFGLAGDHAADANGDQRVDAADYTIWRDAFGAGAVAVPEPCALSLAALAAFAARRRPGESA